MILFRLILRNIIKNERVHTPILPNKPVILLLSFLLVSISHPFAFAQEIPYFQEFPAISSVGQYQSSSLIAAI